MVRFLLRFTYTYKFYLETVLSILYRLYTFSLVKLKHVRSMREDWEISKKLFIHSCLLAAPLIKFASYLIDSFLPIIRSVRLLNTELNSYILDFALCIQLWNQFLSIQLVMIEYFAFWPMIYRLSPQIGDYSYDLVDRSRLYFAFIRRRFSQLTATSKFYLLKFRAFIVEMT